MHGHGFCRGWSMLLLLEGVFFIFLFMSFKIGDKVQYSISYLTKKNIHSMDIVLAAFVVDGFDVYFGCDKELRLKRKDGVYIYANAKDLEKIID